MRQHRWSRMLSRAALTLIALAFPLVLGAAANAQAPKTTKKKSSDISAKDQAQLEKLEGKLRDVGQKLHTIQQKALEDNKPLRKEMDKLGRLIQTEMKKSGVDPEQEVASLQKLQEKLQQEKTSEAERKKGMAELQRRMYKLKSAEMKAMQADKIQKARESMQKKMEAAMVKADPSAAKLLKEYKTLLARMEKILSAKQPQQAG